MGKNGKVVIKETVHSPRNVVWLCVGKTYQIRTSRAIFALAKVESKKKGNVVIAFFGASRAKYLRKSNTPLFKALRPILQVERLPLRAIVEAREVVL